MTSLLPTVLLVSLFPWSTDQLPRSGLCRRQKSFNDKLMTTYMIERHEDVRSLARCAIVCFTDLNCGSFFYHKTEKFCQLHTVLFITPSDATDHPGTWYFEITQDWCPDEAGYVLHRSPVLCYKIHNLLQDYGEAKNTCVSEGGSLLKVKDEDISLHMFEFLRASSDVRQTHFLIGADDIDEAGQYKWVDGDLVTWTNWASGEPSHVTERCLAMAWFYFFKWNDIPCTTAFNFICEIHFP